MSTETSLRDRAMRSLLFSPGDSDRKMRKALGAGADAVIFDLEDSVVPAAKAAARAAVGGLLAEKRSCPVIVRVNAQDTPCYIADIANVAPAAPDAIMLPKCAGPGDLARLSHQLDVLEAVFDLEAGTIGIIPLITESAVSLATMDYREVTPRLIALGFAGEDLAGDLGVVARGPHGMNPLLAQARRDVAIAAATAGVRAIDTPFPDPRDMAGLAREVSEAVELGYAGKLCIHPAQVASVHEGFRPDPAQVSWSRAVIDALEGGAPTGTTLVNGKMVDRAHLRLARRYLQLAGLEGFSE